jgi:hypothetical protein
VFTEYTRKRNVPVNKAVPRHHKPQTRVTSNKRQADKQDLLRQLETLSNEYTYFPIDLVVNMKKPQINGFLDYAGPQLGNPNFTRSIKREIQTMSEHRSLNHILGRFLNLMDAANIGISFDSYFENSMPDV